MLNFSHSKKEKINDLLFGKGGVVVAVDVPSPYVWDNGVVMTREKYEEKQRQDKENDQVWRF